MLGDSQFGILISIFVIVKIVSSSKLKFQTQALRALVVGILSGASDLQLVYFLITSCKKVKCSEALGHRGPPGQFPNQSLEESEEL